MSTIYIRKFLSGFLLLVFALSVTPKRFLHNMFAKHIDNKSTYKNNLLQQITTLEYNCDCDNTVTESPFVTDPQIFPFPLFNSYFVYLVKDNSYSSISQVYSQLRGPPINLI